MKHTIRRGAKSTVVSPGWPSKHNIGRTTVRLLYRILGRVRTRLCARDANAGQEALPAIHRSTTVKNPAIIRPPLIKPRNGYHSVFIDCYGGSGVIVVSQCCVINADWWSPRFSFVLRIGDNNILSPGGDLCSDQIKSVFGRIVRMT